MIHTDYDYQSMINSPARSINARVELYNGSTLLDTFTYDGALKDFTIDRVGESSRFFGFGICQKLTVNLLDREREIDIKRGNGLEVVFGVENNYIYPCPIFFVEEVKRDENTNALTITAYDAIYKATNHTLKEVVVPNSYSIFVFAHAIATFLGLPLLVEGVEDGAFDTLYPEQANFEGTETIRDVLDKIAEATQTIYFVDENWNLTFKRLDRDGEPVLAIDKSQYFTLSSKDSYMLNTITHVTDLGDNASVSLEEDGVTQYVRNNPFWDLRDDIETLLSNAMSAVCGITINQIDCSWRGNFLLELGDKFTVVTKDNDVVTCYLLNDIITYSGGLKGQTRWNFTDNSNETPSNPVTIGESIKQTVAKVDKANQNIKLLASDITDNKEKIADLEIGTNSISASVSRIESETKNSIDGVLDEVDTVKSKVNAIMTPEELKIEVMKELENGIDIVKTNTGYVFGTEGLTISKTGTEISTTITEDGMTVSKSGQEVLVANNVGVKAHDLHADTYLFIGKNSRFEDYQNDTRTGLFWIGK